MVAITLDEVTVRHGRQRPALDEVHLQVASGELLVVAGPSGSGKTTLLRTIAGLEHPERGTVSIAGRDVTDAAPGERDVAMVSESRALLSHLTVEENLGFALRLRKVPADETRRRVEAEARVLGLWSKRRRRPRVLSAGERQRTAIGRATARRPAVYLFDEPLAALDPGERDRVRRELQQLQRGLGVTTVYVTHDQRDAMALGDRVAILDRGRIVQVADPLTLYHDPRTLFVAQFIGAPPMGVLRGQLRDDGTTAWVDVHGVALRLLPEQRVALSGSPPTTVAVALRASAVEVGNLPRHPWSRQLATVVAHVEPLGSATVLALTPRGATPTTALLYATVPPTRRPVRGEAITVTLDMRESILFDAASGRRLFPLH